MKWGENAHRITADRRSLHTNPTATKEEPTHVADAIDFDRMTQRLLNALGDVGTESRERLSRALGGAIRDALRQAWNARGAADIATIELQLAQQMGATASGPYTKNLDRALRALDR